MFAYYRALVRGIAQSGSAPALGAGCREFESLYPDHFYQSYQQLNDCSDQYGRIKQLAPVAQLDRATAFKIVNVVTKIGAFTGKQEPVKWTALYRGNLNSLFCKPGLMAIPRKPVAANIRQSRHFKGSICVNKLQSLRVEMPENNRNKQAMFVHDYYGVP